VGYREEGSFNTLAGAIFSESKKQKGKIDNLCDI
jgi:hypothetical protein